VRIRKEVNQNEENPCAHCYLDSHDFVLCSYLCSGEPCCSLIRHSRRDKKGSGDKHEEGNKEKANEEDNKEEEVFQEVSTQCPGEGCTVTMRP
jgi:hypothetical protein